jgi:aryl-alcohol dehydrogenase-like predicted oxidoreductase
MKYNFLGNTGLAVSELCFGTMTFGGGTGIWQAIGRTQQKEVNELMILPMFTLTVIQKKYWANP